MFNSEWKKKFLDEYSAKRNVKPYYRRILERNFKRVGERIEDIYEKDACDLSYNEIRDGLATFGGTSYSYLSSMIILLSDYTDWCIENRLSSSLNNSYKLIRAGDINIAESLVSKTLRGYDDLAAFLDASMRPVEDFTSDNMYRAAMWLIFFGVKLKDISNIRFDDYNNSVLKVGEDSIDFSAYDEAREALDIARTQTHYHKGAIPIGYKAVDRLIKIEPSEQISFERKLTFNYTKIVKKYRNKTGNYGYTISDIERSGLFWRMYEQERKHGDIARNDVANDYIYSHYALDKSARLTHYMKQLMSDYNAWHKVI